MLVQEIMHAVDDAFAKNENSLAGARADIMKFLRTNFPPERDLSERDDCRFCRGTKGGVKGNENVMGGVVVCDYCTIVLMDVIRNMDEEKRQRAAQDL